MRAVNLGSSQYEPGMRNAPALAPVPPVRRFGRFELRPHERALLSDGIPVALGARAFDLLVAFAEQPGTLITKDDLLATVWPGVVVEENNLQVQVSTLRKILGPGALATIPGRGYRFNLAVTSENPEAQSSAAEIRSTGTGASEVLQSHAFSNLSSRPPQLYGRADDVAAIVALLRRHPIVTITGSGGIGKTRVAQAVARQLLTESAERYPDGVWWVELSALADGALVPSAIAEAMNLSFPAERPTPQALGAELASRRALLVLDNCEHLAESRGPAPGRLRRRRVAPERAHHQPGNAARERRTRVSPRRAGRARRARCRDGLACRCGGTFRRACAGRGSAIRSDAGQFAGSHRNLPPSRRHSARHRAGGGAHAAARRRRLARPPARAVQRADRWCARRPAPPSDAARDAGVEPCAAHARRADRIPQTGCLRRRLHTRGGSARRERRAHRSVDHAGSPRRARGEIARTRRRRSGPALPDAGDDARLRAGAARASRRNAGEPAPSRAGAGDTAGAARASRMAVARNGAPGRAGRARQSACGARMDRQRRRRAAGRDARGPVVQRLVVVGAHGRGARSLPRTAPAPRQRRIDEGCSALLAHYRRARPVFDPARRLRRRRPRGGAVSRARRRAAAIRVSDPRGDPGHALRQRSRR